MKKLLIWIFIGTIAGICLFAALRSTAQQDAQQPIYDMPIFTTIDSIDRRLL